MIIKKPLSILIDAVGQHYVGIKISANEISNFINQLKNHLGDQYDDYFKNKYIRDGNHYHVTVFSVFDYLSKKEQIKPLLGMVTEIELLNIGKAEKNGNTTFFIIVDSDDLTNIVKEYGGKQKDFHITLAFNQKDVFGVSKGIETKII